MASHESNESTYYIYQNKITNVEVKKNIMKPNSSRASGFDKILAKMTKYGFTELHSIITTVLNQCIRKNIDTEVRFGLLNAIQKPNKPIGPVTNLRTWALIPSNRKILSNIVLSRIEDKVERYLSSAKYIS